MDHHRRTNPTERDDIGTISGRSHWLTAPLWSGDLGSFHAPSLSDGEWGVAYPMAQIDSWVDECRAALAQAERLSAQLGRLCGEQILGLGELSARIARLRAAVETLDAMRGLDLTAPSGTQLPPEWMKPARSPWCPPDGSA